MCVALQFFKKSHFLIIVPLSIAVYKYCHFDNLVFFKLFNHVFISYRSSDNVVSLCKFSRAPPWQSAINLWENGPGLQAFNTPSWYVHLCDKIDSFFFFLLIYYCLCLKGSHAKNLNFSTSSKNIDFFFCGVYKLFICNRLHKGMKVSEDIIVVENFLWLVTGGVKQNLITRKVVLACKSKENLVHGPALRGSAVFIFMASLPKGLGKMHTSLKI